MTLPTCPHLSGESVCSICADLASTKARLATAENDLRSATASYRAALDHLRYITTNREWGKSIRYPELDDFMAKVDG